MVSSSRIQFGTPCLVVLLCPIVRTFAMAILVIFHHFLLCNNQLFAQTAHFGSSKNEKTGQNLFKSDRLTENHRKLQGIT